MELHNIGEVNTISGTACASCLGIILGYTHTCIEWGN